MTELLILANIIYSFRKTYLKINPHKHFLSFRILTYAEVWILLNLVLSITISVPAINYYTHGTHITVAHAMGATIGINTLLLLASMVLIGEEITKDGYLFTKAFNRSFIFFNAALLVFWICLVGMGLCKIAAQQQKNGFYEIMDKLLPYFKVFSISGILVVVGLVLVLIPLLKVFLSQLFPQKESVKAEK
jgi:nitric oxide reductase subunit B